VTGGTVGVGVVGSVEGLHAPALSFSTPNGRHEKAQGLP
jgi:hypothetical protein